MASASSAEAQAAARAEVAAEVEAQAGNEAVAVAGSQPARRRPGRGVTVTRRPEIFESDDSRVITRFFNVGGEDRTRRVIERVLNLNEAEVEHLYRQVRQRFTDRHRNLDNTFENHFKEVERYVSYPHLLTEARRLLIGAYFTMEYSIEAAALFNPSMVAHPVQEGVDAEHGELRFIMSLRATGEGHVSSIVFRTGKVCCDGHLEFDPPSRFASKLRVKHDRYFNKRLFFLKLIEMGAYTEVCEVVLDELPAQFSMEQLTSKLAEVRERPGRPSPFTESSENMLWLARSNYRLTLNPNADPSDIVIFPSTENESRGIEDCRLTRFVDDDGEVTYFGTYSAYNGFKVLPQLMETKDFLDVEVHTLNGKYVQNKGMALFPRKIDGMYHMIGRLDGENMYVMRSDNVHFWNEAERLQSPRYAWEFVQIGNCGPPIETEAGWLLLTHGVGPMREYCIGASLLDLADPSKIVGHLREPLLVPEADERDGYVPNVVYSCGAMRQGDTLIMPYAMSDSASKFATIDLGELIGALCDGGALESRD